jgi:hypothetical protein
MRASARSPAGVLARQVVRRLGPALLHAGSNGTALAIAALVVALLGVVAGWFSFPATGFGLCAVSWVLFVTSAMLGRIERDSLHLPAPRFEREIAFAWIMDAALAALMAGTIALPPGQSWLTRLFAPVMLLGLARLVPAMAGGSTTRRDSTRRDWAAWLQDRSVLAAVLALMAFFGVAGRATSVLAVLYLGVGLAASGRPPKDAA